MGNAGGGQILHLINMPRCLVKKAKCLEGYFAAVVVTPRLVSVCKIVCPIVFARLFLNYCLEWAIFQRQNIKKKTWKKK